MVAVLQNPCRGVQATLCPAYSSGFKPKTEAPPELSAEPQADTDPYLWLADVRAEAALDWERTQNEPTLAELCGERFEQLRAEALEIGNADTRIPTVKRRLARPDHTRGQALGFRGLRRGGNRSRHARHHDRRAAWREPRQRWGLLMGIMLNQFRQLFGPLVCDAPGAGHAPLPSDGCRCSFCG